MCREQQEYRMKNSNFVCADTDSEQFPITLSFYRSCDLLIDSNTSSVFDIVLVSAVVVYLVVFFVVVM